MVADEVHMKEGESGIREWEGEKERTAFKTETRGEKEICICRARDASIGVGICGTGSLG